MNIYRDVYGNMGISLIISLTKRYAKASRLHYSLYIVCSVREYPSFPLNKSLS